MIYKNYLQYIKIEEADGQTDLYGCSSQLEIIFLQVSQLMDIGLAEPAGTILRNPVFDFFSSIFRGILGIPSWLSLIVFP